MGESSTVYEQTVKKKGYWNFSDLYQFCFNWLKDHNLSVEENEYTEKDSGVKEIQIKWTAKKKINDYFKNQIKIEWHIIAMSDAEIERGGKKQKTNKGDLKIKIKATLESDYENRWENKPFNKFIRAIYDNYIIKSTKDDYEDRLEEIAVKFAGDLKSFLELSA